MSLLSGLKKRIRLASDALVPNGPGGEYVTARTFTDRRSAGLMLAKALRRLQLPPNPEVLALPRGGVPVGFEIARALHVPLGVMIVRKIGMPGQPELAIGAIAQGGVIVREPGLEGHLRMSGIQFDELVRAELHELERRQHVYQHDAAPLDLTRRTVLLVDDGLATGATMLAGLRAARKAGATRVIAVAPVASDDASARVSGEADQTLFLKVPAYLNSIGEWYDEFPQLTDAEVLEYLEKAAELAPSSGRQRRAPESRS